MTANLQSQPPANPGADSEIARRPRAVPLRDARDAKRLLARIVNDVRRGDLDPRRASVVVYATNIFLSAAAAADVDERLDAIERRLEGRP